MKIQEIELKTRLFIQLIFQKYRIEYRLIFPKYRNRMLITSNENSGNRVGNAPFYSINFSKISNRVLVNFSKIQKSNVNINLHQMKIQKIELETRLFIQLIFQKYRIEYRLIFPKYKNRILIYIK